MLLRDKVVMITGAASGIGAATAEVCARHGADVVIGDIDEDGAKQVAETVREHGRQALAVRVDVRRGEDVAALVDAAVNQYGRLDCAVNNAGIDGLPGRLHESTEDTFDAVIALNLKGVWWGMRHEISHMLAAGGGSIVNISSIAGMVGLDQGMSAYVASKHGVLGLTRAAALEYATDGIRVNAVCPGAVRTSMLDETIAKGTLTEEEAGAMQPIRRLGKPTEVAEIVAWLCSDAASFVTGATVAADGGYTAA